MRRFIIKRQDCIDAVVDGNDKFGFAEDSKNNASATTFGPKIWFPQSQLEYLEVIHYGGFHNGIIPKAVEKAGIQNKAEGMELFLKNHIYWALENAPEMQIYPHTIAGLSEPLLLVCADVTAKDNRLTAAIDIVLPDGIYHIGKPKPIDTGYFDIVRSENRMLVFESTSRPIKIYIPHARNKL